MPRILVPLVVIVVVLALFVVLQAVLNRNSQFRCGRCGATFPLSSFTAALTPHRFGQKLATCPRCGARTWATRVPKD